MNNPDLTETIARMHTEAERLRQQAKGILMAARILEEQQPLLEPNGPVPQPSAEWLEATRRDDDLTGLVVDYSGARNIPAKVRCIIQAAGEAGIQLNVTKIARFLIDTQQHHSTMSNILPIVSRVLKDHPRVSFVGGNTYSYLAVDLDGPVYMFDGRDIRPTKKQSTKNQ